MPIIGLTDRNEGSFPQIGTVRKGAPKTQNAPGKDLAWFRVEFDEKETLAAQAFTARFGSEPTDIVIVLPFDEVGRCWEAWREAYVAGALIHRCDGEIVQYAINPKTGEKIVVNGIGPDGRPVRCKGKPDGCRPVGRLRVIVPELQRLAYLVVMTTSIHDIINISDQLQGIASMNGGRLAGIPLVLRRRPKEISTPSGEAGKRARRKKYLVSIEADPEWVKAKLGAMHRSALPGNGFDPGAALPAPAHTLQPSGPEWTEVEDDEGELMEESASEEAPRQDALSPESIRAKVAGFVGVRDGQAANERQVGLAQGMLAACFNTDDVGQRQEMRHRTLLYLCNVGSASELHGPHHLAILDWLKPSRDDGGKYQPSEQGAKEARIVEHAALMSEGHLESPGIGVEETPF